MSVYRIVAHFYGYASSCIQGIAWDLTSIHPSIMERPICQRLSKLMGGRIWLESLGA